MSFAALVSPEYDSVAVLVTVGAAALAILTVSVMLVVANGASAPGMRHVTFCPAVEHVQPFPVAETKPRPVGNVSTTVIPVFVASAPRLLTVKM